MQFARILTLLPTEFDVFQPFPLPRPPSTVGMLSSTSQSSSQSSSSLKTIIQGRFMVSLITEIHTIELVLSYLNQLTESWITSLDEDLALWQHLTEKKDQHETILDTFPITDVQPARVMFAITYRLTRKRIVIIVRERLMQLLTLLRRAIINEIDKVCLLVI
jgi:hypothetical protein